MSLEFWRNSVRKEGHATCNYCNLSFLTVKGVLNHSNKCDGDLAHGQFVQCPLCPLRFKTFRSLRPHLHRCRGANDKNGFYEINLNSLFNMSNSDFTEEKKDKDESVLSVSVSLSGSSIDLPPLSSSETPSESALLMLEENLSAEERRLMALEQKVLETERRARKRKLELREERVKRRREELNMRLQRSLAILNNNDEVVDAELITNNENSDQQVYVVIQQSGEGSMEALELQPLIENSSSVPVDNPPAVSINNLDACAVANASTLQSDKDSNLEVSSRLVVVDENLANASSGYCSQHSIREGEETNSSFLLSNASSNQLMVLQSQVAFTGELVNSVETQSILISQPELEQSESKENVSESEHNHPRPQSDSQVSIVPDSGPTFQSGSTSLLESKTSNLNAEVNFHDQSIPESSLEQKKSSETKDVPETASTIFNNRRSTRSLTRLLDSGSLPIATKREKKTMARPLAKHKRKTEDKDSGEKAVNEDSSKMSESDDVLNVSQRISDKASNQPNDPRNNTGCVDSAVDRIENTHVSQLEEHSSRTEDNEGKSVTNSQIVSAAESSQVQTKESALKERTDEISVNGGQLQVDSSDPRNDGGDNPLNNSLTTVISTTEETTEKTAQKSDSGDQAINGSGSLPSTDQKVNGDPTIRDKSSSKGEKDLSRFECGKCGAVFKTIASFRTHRASRHGGLARLAHENQSFTESETEDLINDAFGRVKAVPCPTCLEKKFTTKPGMRYHRKTCGKSEQDVENLKEKCPHCDYRGVPACLRYHIARHFIKVEPEPKKVEEEDESRRSGKRKAAINALLGFKKSVGKKCDEDKGDTTGTDDDDVAADLDEDDEEDDSIEASGKPRKKRGRRKPGRRSTQTSATYFCGLCDGFTGNCQRDVELHVSSKHGKDVLKSTNAFRLVVRGGNRYDRGQSSEVEPSIVTLFDEKIYRERNYHCNNFEHLVEKDYGEVLSFEQATKYLPGKLKSKVFDVLHGRKKLEEDLILNRFEARTHSNESHTFFCGGPVISGALHPEYHRAQSSENSLPSAVLALSALRSWDDCHSSCEAYSSNQSLQIWQRDRQTNEFRLNQVIVHELGPVFSTKWAPSGNILVSDEPSYNRLGILACACTSGVVALFSVPDWKGDEPLLLRPRRPTLLLSCNSKSACLDLSWFRGLKHRVIAAGYGDGSVALFDLMSAQKAGDTLVPYERIIAHQSPVNSLDLSDYSLDDDPEFPAFLVTGSTSDHCASVWRLDDSESRPTQVMNRGQVRRVQWLPHYRERLLVSCDDLSSSNPCIVELGPDRVRVNNVLTMPSVAVQTQDLSQWLSASGIVGTTGGDIALFLGSCRRRSLENDKGTIKRRFLLSSQRLHKDKIVFRDCLKSGTKLEHCLNSDSELVRRMEGLDSESFHYSPLTQITWVAMHQSPRQLGCIASANVAGLVRVHHVPALRDAGVASLLEGTHDKTNVT